MATIQLVHIPIRNGWTGATHQFLVLTRDNGAREFIRGGPTKRPGLPSFLPQGKSENTNPFGAIVVQTGPYDTRTPDFPVKETEYGMVFDKERYDSWVKTSVIEGPEKAIADIWIAMSMTARGLNSQSIPYCPLTQNSNSVANECLRRHGLGSKLHGVGYPWGHKLGLTPWAPGAENTLQARPPAVIDDQAKKLVQDDATRLSLAFKVARITLRATGSLTPAHRPRRGLKAGYGE